MIGTVPQTPDDATRCSFVVVATVRSNNDYQPITVFCARAKLLRKKDTDDIVL